ncbi:protein Cripto-like [Eulemur rufifrons]|uniref:protein Cripto-like n=1 Tax=Eulemur rufifrons TaxID=859984 RepID=UPI0037421EFA
MPELIKGDRPPEMRADYKIRPDGTMWLKPTDYRKMARFSSSVILIMAFSTAFELGLVAGLAHKLTDPSQEDVAFRNDSIRSQEGPAVHLRSSLFVPPMRIKDKKELNRTCCLNGGTCALGAFCACLPFFYGRNCQYDSRKDNCGTIPHDTWLPKKCSFCRCWHGELRCIPQTFLPGCDDNATTVEPLNASGTPEIPLSAWITFMLAGICLSLQSYY